MVRVSTDQQPGGGVKIIGLATERCQAVKGTTVRVYFRLSTSPPVGWPYIFTVIWQIVQFPLKLNAGVEEDSIWIECDPGDVGPVHLEKLEAAVAQTNAKYRQGAQQQALNAGRQAQLNAQVRSQLDDLNRTLFPANASTGGRGAKRQFRRTGLIVKLARFFGGGAPEKG